MSVIIEGGRIRRVDRSKGAAGAHGVDGKGKFLIPGLWDMHVHLAQWDSSLAPGIWFPLFVANGVTGVRDMGSDLAAVTRWRQEIRAGRLTGPRILLPGPMLDGPAPRFGASVGIATAEDGRRAVRELERQGVDFIKLQSLVPRDAAFAILDEARLLGLTVVGHVPDAVRAREASARGVKSFEHLIGIFEGSSPDEDKYLSGAKSPGKFLATFEPERAAALFQFLAKNQTWQCPALVWERGGALIEELDLTANPLGRFAPAWYKNGSWKRLAEMIARDFNVDDLSTRRRFVAKEFEVTGAMHRAGVPFLAGTDTPAGVFVFPGFSLHEELAILVQSGFSPQEALATATTNPAAFLGRQEDLGSVEAGKLADLVLLDANPLDDIRNTQRIAGVFLAGRYLSRTDLDRLLADAALVAAGSQGK